MVSHYYFSYLSPTESYIGAIPIQTVGKEFDEECMDGAFVAPCDEYHKNIVFVELEKGYRSKFDDKCFRPALVGVSSGDEEMPFQDFSDIVSDWDSMNITDFNSEDSSG